MWETLLLSNDFISKIKSIKRLRRQSPNNRLKTIKKNDRHLETNLGSEDLTPRALIRVLY